MIKYCYAPKAPKCKPNPNYIPPASVKKEK